VVGITFVMRRLKLRLHSSLSRVLSYERKPVDQTHFSTTLTLGKKDVPALRSYQDVSV